ncbi:MAG: hypothetical protein JRI58_08160 [Deltaproteobacteria bacterium]|nr:hypothetical protein [Deltaproteobacteria bacterium]MBW2074704.1 hypothetical protein [Deltaproteobacteria bacterium]
MIPLVQLPLGVWQALTVGLGDHVQGTFVRMGAGAHVAGAVALIGVLICIVKGLWSAILVRRLLWLFGGILLFIFPVLADAKQAIIAFLPALILLMITLKLLPMNRLIVVLTSIGIAILVAFSYYPPLQRSTDWSLVGGGVLGKVQGFAIVANRLSDNPGFWLLGLGPGNSVSRVALMGLQTYVKSSSPVYLLGLSAAPTTQKIWAMTSSNWLFASSSVWSGISSWLGLFGDLGLVGLFLYLWMSWKLWHALKGYTRWEAAIAKAVMVMSGLLGAMYSWLEEPGFTLVVATVVGLGVTACKEEDDSVQDPERP